MRVLIVIPARGGSKRIPLKNIVLLSGKPLLEYTFNAINKSKVKHEVIVSTDHPKIADFSKSFGFSVLNRPSNISKNTSSTEEVLFHVLKNVKNKSSYPEWIMILPPTSPFRSARTILLFLKKLETVHNDVDCILSVNENRGDFWKLDKNNNLIRLLPNAPRRQQDRDPLLEENSAVYLTKVSSLLKTKSILGKKVDYLIISKEEGLDINTSDDLITAEAMINNKDFINVN